MAYRDSVAFQEWFRYSDRWVCSDIAHLIQSYVHGPITCDYPEVEVRAYTSPDDDDFFHQRVPYFIRTYNRDHQVDYIYEYPRGILCVLYEKTCMRNWDHRWSKSCIIFAYARGRTLHAIGHNHQYLPDLGRYYGDLIIFQNTAVARFLYPEWSPLFILSP